MGKNFLEFYMLIIFMSLNGLPFMLKINIQLNSDY